MRIRHDHQFFIYHALFKNIRAIANQFSRLHPVFAAFNIRFLDRIKGKTGGQTGKPGQRLVKLNTQSVRVHGTDAKLIRRDFTVDNGLRISDASQSGKPGEGGKRFGINEALPAIDKILGGHRRSIGPLCIIPQRKRPDTIIIALPLAGDARDNFTLFVLVNQPFKQIADHLNFRQPNGFRWI